jgi:1-acyl-sn-glycerol-3-phosphate acyltransferase
MLNKLWLYSIRTYLSIGLFFYYRRIKVVNLDNIPKGKPLLILCNHQNALLDPLIIAVKYRHFSYFLTRAAVFKSPFIAKILKSLRMLPVYRIRDGFNVISKNNDIFKTCSELLNNDEAVVIFPEGSHNLNRTVRPLSKGFTRIVFDTLELYPTLDLNLIPVGLNYKNPEKFVDEVSMHFGKPITSQDFVSDDRNKDVKTLKNAVHQSISKLTTHIPPSDYDETLQKLLSLNVNFLNPQQINSCISKNFEGCSKQKKTGLSGLKQFFKILLIINLWFPYFIWKWYIEPKIDEIEFVSTFRFTVAITLVPFYLLIIIVLLSLFYGWLWALTYFIFVLGLALLAIKL